MQNDSQLLLSVLRNKPYAQSETQVLLSIFLCKLMVLLFVQDKEHSLVAGSEKYPSGQISTQVFAFVSANDPLHELTQSLVESYAYSLEGHPDGITQNSVSSFPK